MNFRSILVVLFLLVPALALAHPGHGETDPGSWTHYLTEPVHVIVLAAVVAVIAAIGWRRSRVRRLR